MSRSTCPADNVGHFPGRRIHIVIDNDMVKKRYVCHFHKGIFKAMGNHGIGVDPIDVDYATEIGLPVIFTPYGKDSDVAVDFRPRATCAVCLVQEGGAFWAHIGDSRIYHAPKGEHSLKQLSEEVIADMAAEGEWAARIKASFDEFQRIVIPSQRIGELAYMNAREL